MKCEYDNCDKKAIGKFEVLIREPKLETIIVWLCKEHKNQERNNLVG